MTVTLRVVLDQLVAATDPDLATASRELARALVLSSPDGCDVGAIVPSGPHGVDVAGVTDVHRMGMARRRGSSVWHPGSAAA